MIPLAPGAGRRAEGQLWRQGTGKLQGTEGVADEAQMQDTASLVTRVALPEGCGWAGRRRGLSGTFSREFC